MYPVKSKIIFGCQKIISRPGLVFLLLSLIFGIVYVFQMGPLIGTDEFTHFPHAVQISQGIFWERRLPGNQYGGYLPSNINNMVNDYRNLSRIPNGPQYSQTEQALNNKYGKLTNPGSIKQQSIFTSTVIYPPWAYVAPLIGILLAKALHLPLLWYIYLSRMTTLLVWLVLGYLAIRVLPKGKWFLVGLGLLPTTLSQAATISADSLLSGLSWLLIALSLAMLSKSIKLKWWLAVFLSALGVYIALIKDGYFLLGLVIWVIPASNLARPRLVRAWQGLTTLAIAVASFLFTLREVHTVNGVVLTPTYGINFNGQAQIHYMVSHWFSFGLRILEQPFTKSFDTTYQGIVGIYTNRLIYLSILVMGLLFSSLIMGLSHTRRNEALEPRSKIRLVSIFAAIFILTYALLAAAFYIGNTGVGAQFVNGYYGRYFLPFLPLLLAFPYAFGRRRTANWPPLFITGVSIVGLYAMIASLP